uniref:Uncharacterized protein n=1 Tax=Avena sativa TaxID=4498 RepID=A0ACD5TBK0_AVESA
MAAPTPAFTDSFLVEENNYGAFIRIVRQNMIKYCTDRRPDGIVQPVLPLEQPVPSRWFHVLLRNTKTNTSSITLAVRMDNLYLVGFKTLAGVWWEFGKEGDTRLIKGSKWLGFGGRYQDLIGQKALDTVTLGRAEMSLAVDVLARYVTPKAASEEPQGLQVDPYAVPKSKLAKLVIMICEGLRFFTVSGTVDKKFDTVNATITDIEGKQVNKWDRICVAVFKWAKDPSAKFPDLEKVGVKNKTDAERVVALVKDQPN